jgi:hypothetical protein
MGAILVRVFSPILLAAYLLPLPPSAASGFRDLSRNPLVVAIIDAGADIRGLASEDLLWRNKDESMDGIDTDANGLVDDVVGWDFAENDNYPFDWGSISRLSASSIGTPIYHGSAVTDLFLRELGWKANWQVRVMPLRVTAGRSPIAIADLQAALSYAAHHQADLVLLAIGGSWPTDHSGFDTTLDALGTSAVVLAAGNEGVEIQPDSTQASLCDRENVICVASHGDGYDLGTAHTGSNYSARFVDLSADGGPVEVDGPLLTSEPVSGTLLPADGGLQRSCVVMSEGWSTTRKLLVREIVSNDDLPGAVLDDRESEMICPSAEGHADRMQLEGTSIAAARVAGGLAAFAITNAQPTGDLVSSFLMSMHHEAAQDNFTIGGRVYGMQKNAEHSTPLVASVITTVFFSALVCVSWAASCRRRLGNRNRG